MKPITVKEVLRELLHTSSLDELTEEQLINKCVEIEEQANEDRLQDEQDELWYGSADDDEYQMSDSYYADVESEKYEWIKNA